MTEALAIAYALAGVLTVEVAIRAGWPHSKSPGFSIYVVALGVFAMWPLAWVMTLREMWRRAVR